MSCHSQRLRILAWLKSGRVLTPLGALRLCGSWRAGARIYDLRRAGYDIKTRMVRKGSKRFAEYRLAH